MTLKKCDRCGKIFEPTDNSVSGVSLFVYNGNHTSWQNGDHFDFCNGCTEKVDRFLREKNNAE